MTRSTATRIEDTTLGSTARSIAEVGLAATRAIGSNVPSEQRLGLARSMAHAVAKTYWQGAGIQPERPWPIRKVPRDIQLCTLPSETEDLARRLGKAAAELDPLEAAYATGMLYTGMMPDRLRATLGAYYTPPALCERLLDMASDAGVDWSRARVLDPACGGGAFLAPVALRMARGLGGLEADAVLHTIERRLVGFELDSFAAWMSQVFLDAALTEQCRVAGRRIRRVVRVCDSLDRRAAGQGFDLVVGNPPYGRLKLPPRLRSKFARSLFGHANLYGLFTDLALRLTRNGGVIAYVTPTSLLSGEYFKALRGLLGREAPPVGIDFVALRKGVFANVLQETLLATYKRAVAPGTGRVHHVVPTRDGPVKAVTAGSFNLPAVPEEPWLIPRSEAQDSLLRVVGALPHRLSDWGYTVSTGPLVWNRHKEGLRERPGKRRHPLVWAESVRPDGSFEFRASKRNHKPYFEPREHERWVVTDFPCVLVQRTTAKEQCRRLIAAELPATFLDEHGPVVVENHLNMVKALDGIPKVAPAALAALLNSDLADQVFRCINGSVAVSAYELQALPLPAADSVKEIERLVACAAERDAVEEAVVNAYGCREA